MSFFEIRDLKRKIANLEEDTRTMRSQLRDLQLRIKNLDDEIEEEKQHEHNQRDFIDSS